MFEFCEAVVRTSVEIDVDGDFVGIGISRNGGEVAFVASLFGPDFLARSIIVVWRNVPDLVGTVVILVEEIGFFVGNLLGAK